MRDLWRMALWGMGACAAIVLVVAAASTQTGRDRVRLAASHLRDSVRPPEARPVRPFDAREGRRLAETVRTLTADRDRLMARIATLEQGLDNITGSIARVEKVAKAARQPQPEPFAGAAARAAPMPGALPQDVTSSVDLGGIPVVPNAASKPTAPPPTQPLAAPSVPETRPSPTQAATESRSPPANEAIKTEFGLDIGGSGSVEGLRALWTAARQRHAAQLAGLMPVMHLRERPRPAVPELRLVAGPIANAAAAARLCAAIADAGGVCQPAVYDGQRLAVR
jgi:hypothetical protein